MKLHLLTLSLFVCLLTSAVAQETAPTLTTVFGLGFGCNEIVASNGLQSFGTTSCDNPAATTFSYAGDTVEADWSGDVGSRYISSCGAQNSDGTYFPFGEPIRPISCDGLWIVGGLNYLYHNGIFFDGSEGVDTMWRLVLSTPRGDAFVLGQRADGPVIAKFGNDNHRVFLKKGVHGVAMARDTGGNFYIAEGNLLKKYAPNLSKLIYSRRFKGASISAIFVDSFNQLYLTGTTFDPTLRAVHAAQPELGGEVDAFVIALTAAGNRITYSSFIGGKGNERAAGLSVDEEGNVFVAGTDLSFAWDGRPDPCDTGDANCSEGLYVAKFGPLRISQLPGKIEFGPRHVGSTTTKKILLTNLGNVPLRVSNVQLSSSDFVETNTCVAPILPDKACTISVSFKPSSQGTQVTTMVVVSDSLKSPQRVRLTGQGR